VVGLRARGGFEVELSWKNNRMTAAKIKSTGGRKATVRHGERTAEIQLKPGATVVLNAELQP